MGRKPGGEIRMQLCIIFPSQSHGQRTDRVPFASQITVRLCPAVQTKEDLASTMLGPTPAEKTCRKRGRGLSMAKGIGSVTQVCFSDD